MGGRLIPALVAHVAASAIFFATTVAHASQVPGAPSGGAAMPAQGAVPTPGAPPAVPGQPGASPQNPADAGQAPGAPAPLATRVFATETGLLFSPVRPEKTRVFEEALARVHQALATSTDATRRRQAEGWKVFRAAEPGPGGAVLYVFLMSPAVRGADYAIGKVLQEAYPAEEALDIFEQYTGALAGSQSLLSLTPAVDFARPWTPVKPAR